MPRRSERANALGELENEIKHDEMEDELAYMIC
jgi:hypothetical protein